MATIKGVRDQLAALSADQVALVEDKSRAWSEKQGEYDSRQKDIDALADVAKSLTSVEDLGDIVKGIGEKLDEPKNAAAKTLGDHFVKTAGEALTKATGNNWTVTAPEVKAASDVNVTGDSATMVQYDTNVVRLARQAPTIADLLASGTLSQPTLQYWVQGAVEGAPTAVAENAQKPFVHFTWSEVTESLKKLAALTKVSDEMRSDLDFLVSIINQDLVTELLTVEEAQLLTGAGTGANLHGLTLRSGIQTEAATTAVSGADNADALFRAMTKVQTATFLRPNGVVMHPADYQALRLKRDSNGQYYGGGFFQGQYGSADGLQWAQPVWGLKTVVTSAIASGTALVGDFSQGTVYRKGGVSVDATNSNEDDFEFNRITLRAEERLALAVRRPAAFVKVTLDYASA